MISLNIIFWSIIVTVAYLLFINDIRKRSLKSSRASALAILTAFYLIVLLSIWFVYPEGWF